MTPDPFGGDISNPQSLNRYAYALNNPTTNIDPLGLDSFSSGDECSGDAWITDASCPGPCDVTDPDCVECVQFGICPWPYSNGGGGGGTGGGSPPPTPPPPVSPSGPFNGPSIGAPPGFVSTADTIAQIGVYASPWEIDVVSICASDPACLAVLLGAGGVAIAAHEGVLGQTLQTLLPLPVQAGIQINQARKADIQQVRDAARQVSREPGCRPPSPGDFNKVHDILQGKKGPGGKVSYDDLLQAWREVLCR